MSEEQKSFASFKRQATNLAKEVLDEIEQREQRRDNVMIFGLPERVDGSLEERRQCDRGALANLLDEIDFPMAMIAPDIQRMGRVTSGKVRPMIVKLMDRSLKPKFLRKARNLLNSSLHKQVYIKNDLTRVQQNEHFLLRNELKERRAVGEDVVIYNGQVRTRDSLKNFQN